MPDYLQLLNDSIINCKRCPRLAEYIAKVSQTKVRRFKDDEYWAKPLPSFGDPNARLLVVGLAPAAHGGNRTGRMFTGDSSGDWLAKAMFEAGFASVPYSRSKDDGLVLHDAYITAAARCAPPSNKPLPSEIASCSEYLAAELELLSNVKVVLALGRIAFDAYCKAAKTGRLEFGHGKIYNAAGKSLLASYHPSRQNTNTGRLTWQMWADVFRTAKKML